MIFRNNLKLILIITFFALFSGSLLKLQFIEYLYLFFLTLNGYFLSNLLKIKSKNKIFCFFILAHFVLAFLGMYLTSFVIFWHFPWYFFANPAFCIGGLIYQYNV